MNIELWDKEFGGPSDLLIILFIVILFAVLVIRSSRTPYGYEPVQTWQPGHSLFGERNGQEVRPFVTTDGNFGAGIDIGGITVGVGGAGVGL